MFIKSLKLTDFRCYEEAEINFYDKTNIIYGLNAAGKTNVLEAVYLFCTGRSHRRASVKELINENKNMAKIEMSFESCGRDFFGSFSLYNDKKKLFCINESEIKKISEISNYINVVMFSPEDLFLIKGFPSERRRFTDMAISQIRPVYVGLLNEYLKILSQRNALLKRINKNECGTETLDVWDSYFSDLCARICVYRFNFFKQLKVYLYEIYKDISSESLKTKYLCNFYDNFENGCDLSEIKKSVEEKLFLTRKKDIETGATQTGVHKDDILFFINKREVRRYASQGQMRSIVLSLKLALSELIKNEKNDYPIILLDDILSELDENRRSYLNGSINNKQTIITCTDKENNLKNKGFVKYFHVCNRKIKEG